MSTKFYIGYNHAESSSAFIVELTQSEYRAVKKFIFAQYDFVIGGGYCGSFDISDKSFSSREEAIKFVLERGY